MTTGTPSTVTPSESPYRYEPNGTPVCTPTTSTAKPPTTVTAARTATMRGPRVTYACSNAAAATSSTMAIVSASRADPDASG